MSTTGKVIFAIVIIILIVGGIIWYRKNKVPKTNAPITPGIQPIATVDGRDRQAVVERGAFA